MQPCPEVSPYGSSVSLDVLDVLDGLDVCVHCKLFMCRSVTCLWLPKLLHLAAAYKYGYVAQSEAYWSCETAAIVCL